MEDPSNPTKSPQDKKAFSYAKDGRNSYGENDKASRKAIPRRKALENRDDRRKVVQSLCEIQRWDEAVATLIESSMRHDTNRVGGWTKKPDVPLSQHIASQRKRRLQRAPEAERGS
jgi:hypothetical protein